MTDKLCNVAVAVPLRTTFTYKIPAQLVSEIQIGSRVLVPFRKKSAVGVVTESLVAAPPNAKLREVQKSLDFIPALTPKLLELGQWIANYYVAPIGEVYRAMLPPLTELHAHQRLLVTETGRSLPDSLDNSDPPCALLKKLKGAKSGLLLQSAIRSGIARPDLLKLQRRGLIEIRQEVQDRKRRMQRIVAWKETPANEHSASPLAGTDKQKLLSEKEEHLKNLLAVERGPLPLSQLIKLSGLSRAHIDRLFRRGKLESWQEPLDAAEDPFDSGYTPPAHALNAEQDRAFAAIRGRFELGEFGVQLLHGVTGSGKTEVYLRAVQDTLARGKTAIVLVPEIALTLWIGRQCRAWFGARFEGVAVLHSALSDTERARAWWRVRHGEARVVVGTRSAVFAPLENLGLIIVDEEQECSYKQEETPRYHGRDVAIVRAKMENALALLGSATPSLETYHHAREGKYELLTIAARVASRPLPAVEIISLRDEFQQTHKTSPISSALHAGIEECLETGTQALILINRRGYSWSVLCRSCGAS